MRTKTKLTAVKLTPTEIAAAKELVDRGYFKSVSDVLRTALVHFLIAHKVKDETLGQIRLERIAHPMREAKREEEEGTK